MNRRWYFACAGVLVLALLLRQPLILIVGLLALFVFLAIDIWATYCLTDLHFERELSTKRAFFGTEVTLSVTVENAKLLPLPWLEIEDNVSRQVNVRGRRLRINPTTNRSILESLFSVRWYERVTRHYTLACNARGVHTFGPTGVRSGDLFGFTEREQTLENWQYLLVYPLILPLSNFNLPARHPFGEQRIARRLLEDPARVVGVRDYVPGDELRRIHWKATARTRQLQSKVYEPTTTYTLVLFLNVSTQVGAYFSTHPELRELSICAAASVADWGLNGGHAVGLYINGFPYLPEQSSTLAGKQAGDGASVLRTPFKPQRIKLPPASGAEQHRRIMEALARVQEFFGSPIEEMIQGERAHLPAGATVVVITTTISDPLLDTLKRLRQSGHAVTILLASDQPTASRLAGLPVTYLGGEETWKSLVERHSRVTGEGNPVAEQAEIAAFAPGSA